MIFRPLCGLLLLLLASGAQASTLVYNVTGYTMDQGKRISFSALEFEDGVVTRLYPDADSVTSSTAEQRIDGGGATLLPGLIDAHGHVTSHGRALLAVDLVNSPSEADSAARVGRFVEQNADQEWIRGRGWNQVLWPGKQFPDRAALDKVSAGKA
ncbi:MAG: amidohydrolase family protein, partial [Halieaceae bacterium]|nr:amidohydrolase family protein [Halieaceae bacterium]